MLGDFNGHHTLWGCEKVINRGKQLEDLLLKNDLIIFDDKSSTYFHPASGTFTSIDLTLCSPSLYLDFSWRVGPDPCGSDHFPIILENGGPPSLKWFRDGSCRRQIGNNFGICAAPVCTNDSSAGPDEINYQLLKHLPSSSLLLLLNIFNKIWLSRDFPSDWRKVIVIPIPKPGKDPTNPTNYHPIALTSCICKTME